VTASQVITALVAAIAGVAVSPVLCAAISRLHLRKGKEELVSMLARPWRSTPPTRRERFVVPAASALSLGAIGGWLGPNVRLVPFAFLALVVVVVTFIDIDHHRIPDRITLRAFPIAFVLIAVTAVVTGAPRGVIGALIGSLAFGGILFVFHLISPAGMGFGDVKLAFTLGLYVGWVNPFLVLHALMLGAVLGVVVAIPAVVKRGRKAAFPFGPTLCAGTLAAVIFSSALLPNL
jgi:leader peptidase (prepilin peptidase) / N-methyltransferase